MKLFLDTSSLFKLYHVEAGTKELENVLELYPIDGMLIAEITSIEFVSVVYKKLRMKELDIEKANILLSGFQKDYSNFHVVSDGAQIKNLAIELIAKYWHIGLRTLDAIQLASALFVLEKSDLFHSSDIILNRIAEQEGLIISLPTGEF